MSKVTVAKYVALLLFTLTTLSECSYRTIIQQFDVQPLPNEEGNVYTLKTDLDDGLGCIYPTDCQDVKECGRKKSGVYRVFPLSIGDGFLTYCDMQTEGGGWLVFQRRQDGSVDFYRNWTNYTDGFGNLLGEFWLGLEKLHLLTSQRHYELLINLGSYDNGSAHARYDRFFVSDESLKFQLLSGTYSGNAGDSMGLHNGYKFSTFDNNNGIQSENCASDYRGAWWYKSCYRANLNGLYFTVTQKSKSDVKSANWYMWTKSHTALQFIEMKLRPHS